MKIKICETVIPNQVAAFYLIGLATERAFHRFGQAEFPECGSILGSSQFLILPQLPLKTMLVLKVVD